MSGQRAYQLDLDGAFPATVGYRLEGGARRYGFGGRYYHPDLEHLRGRDVSGVYAILGFERDGAPGVVYYVGESHTGRLFQTITRHFRAWSRDVKRDGRRFGGTMYDRERVYVAWVETAPEDAAAVQYANIQALRPRDNDVDGSGAVSGYEIPV